jgi:putative membrane protein
MNILLRFLTVVFAILLASYVVAGVYVDSLYIACIVAVLLGLINLLVRPIFLLITLPLVIATLGIFVFVVNAGILMLLSSFVQGFTVSGFVPAFLSSIIISTTSWVANKFT